MACVNEHCNSAYKHNPLDSPEGRSVNMDGDFACCAACEEAYIQQRDHFLNEILPNDAAYAKWLGIPNNEL